MDGLHIIANFKDCKFDFSHEKNLLPVCIEICQKSGLQVVGQTSYEFKPYGFTFSIILAESHLCIHTWPEQKSVCFDIYTCNHKDNNEFKCIAVYEQTITILQPSIIEEKRIIRNAF